MAAISRGWFGGCPCYDLARHATRLATRITTIVLALGALPACTEGPRVVTIEGTVADELVLSGGAVAAAHRESIFCKGFLLQNPTLKSVSVEGRFRRKAGGRYRLDMDLRDVPNEGFCDWRIRTIFVEARVAGQHVETPLLTLKPANANATSEAIANGLAHMTSTCRYGHGLGAEFISCLPMDREFPKLLGHVSMVLDVQLEDGHADPP